MPSEPTGTDKQHFSDKIRILYYENVAMYSYEERTKVLDLSVWLCIYRFLDVGFHSKRYFKV
jgi:hypothetical protein